MSKYYFIKEEEGAEMEFCYPLDVILKGMIEDENSTLTIYQAKRITGEDYFFCKEFQEITEKDGETCGANCSEYKPRNGKGGICKSWGYCYEPVGDALILTIDSLETGIKITKTWNK
jgi:hypothetical protein